MEIEQIKKFAYSMIPLGRYRDSEPVISKADVEKFISKCDEYERYMLEK